MDWFMGKSSLKAQNHGSFLHFFFKGSRLFDVPSSNWWTISVGVVVDLFIDLDNGVN